MNGKSVLILCNEAKINFIIKIKMLHSQIHNVCFQCFNGFTLFTLNDPKIVEILFSLFLKDIKILLNDTV